MLKIAIVGATGLVGQTFLEVLEEKQIHANYTLFASAKSEGKIIKFMKLIRTESYALTNTETRYHRLVSYLVATAFVASYLRIISTAR